MNFGRCPVCHSHISLEAMVQDEAGRELLGLFAGLDAELSRALVTYLGLFRPARRDLANDRALRLAREVIALTEDRPRLANAVAQTVEALRGRGGGQMKNHHYLQKVLESIQTNPVQTGLNPVKPGKIGKTEEGLMAIEKVKERYR